MSASSRPIPADAPVTTASGRPAMGTTSGARSYAAPRTATYAERVSDPRRQVPRTDAVLADPRLVAAGERLGRDAVKAAVVAAQKAVRAGGVAPDAVADLAVASLPSTSTSLRPVLNA